MNIKKMLSLALAGVMAVSLMACSAQNGGSSSENTSSLGGNNDQNPASVTITSLNASKEAVELEVPYDPQRIAILDMASLDILDALGVGDRVVGTADTSLEYLQGYIKDDIANIGTIKEADLEAVMACKYNGTDLTVEQQQQEMVLVIGENIKVRRFARYDTGLNVPYVHMGGRIAVLVNLETESTDAAVVELGKDIAMQIAALNPTYKDKSDVSEEFIEKEKEIRLAQAKEDPKNAKKPDAIIEKIVMGGIGKYFKEICLLQQPFVKDDKVSVEEHIAAVAKQVGASIKLVNYTRFEKGEGIEKRQDDLAEEVAKLIK